VNSIIRFQVYYHGSERENHLPQETEDPLGLKKNRPVAQALGWDDEKELKNEFNDRTNHNALRLEEIIADLLTKDIFVIAWDPENRVRFSSENTPENFTQIPNDRPLSDEQVFRRTSGLYREAIHANPGGGYLLVGTSIETLENELSALEKKLTLIGTLIVSGGFLIGYLLITRSLKPIETISATAHQIANGDLSQRIKVRGNESELGKLSSVLNETFEKLETSFEHQVRFTADASHEMRTPISVILAKSQFALSRERSPEKYQEALHTCMNSAQHMRTLTEGLLKLSKIDSGAFHLKKEKSDLAKLTQEIVEMIRPLADKRGIKISSELTPHFALFDSQKMRQVLLNLLSNSVKYNREDGEIELSLIEANQKLKLSIRDTGPGMSEEQLPHVFERFYRADQARTHGGNIGTGLGLAITQAIVKAHGGQITVESTPDVGSTFHLSLPTSPA